MSKPYRPETYQAVLSLLKEGKTPSWRAVREITGVGSSNDILHEIKLILSEVAERSTAGEYPKAAQDAFWQLWIELRQISSAELDVQREECASEVLRAAKIAAEAEEKLRAISERLNERDRQITTLTERLEQADRRESHLNSQIEQAAGAIAQERDKFERLRTEHRAEMEAQRIEHRDEITRKDQDIAECQARLKAETEHRNQVVAEMATEHQGAVKHYEQALRNEANRYNDDTARLMRILDSERTQWGSERRAMQDESKVTHEQLSAARQRLSGLEGELTGIQGRLADTRDQRDGLQERNQQLEADITHLTAKLIELTDQVNAARLSQKTNEPG
jgi:chromosome segregation ATPase